MTEKIYRGVKPSEFVPEPPVAPPAQRFTPLGFAEPGDPSVDWDLPVLIHFHKAVYLAGKQFQSVDLKTDRSVRVKLDYGRGLAFVRYDNGSAVGVAATPFDNIHCMHWGLNPKHAADGKAAA